MNSTTETRRTTETQRHRVRGSLGRVVLTAVALAAAAASPFARQNYRTTALDEQIGRILQASELAVARFGPARWLADGNAYTTVEKGDIVRYEAASGARSVLVPSAKLVPPGASSALDIDDYIWSRDAKRLLIFTNTRKVWRQNT